jgi:hypothetical protein
MYFDNHPHGHYGTIKQQWWAFSHFFLHIGLVGIVEGANRIVTCFIALTAQTGLINEFASLCDDNTTETTAAEFVSTLNSTMYDVFNLAKFDYKALTETTERFSEILKEPESAFCFQWDGGPDGTNNTSIGYAVNYYMTQGLFTRYGIESPSDDSLEYARVFQTIYIYLWGSVALTMLMLLIFLWIVRTKKRDAIEFIRLGFRAVMVVLAGGMATIGTTATEEREGKRQAAFYTLIFSPGIVAIVCGIMGACIIFDRICRAVGVWRFERNFAIPAKDEQYKHYSEEVHELKYVSSRHSSGEIPEQEGFQMTPGYVNIPQGPVQRGLTKQTAYPSTSPVNEER